jgi:ectoine hydroxylase-related dioxygenase (phytanoyl-CoA dioxygenase family)
MSTYPDGNLIAAWVALEDISFEQGPLHYYRSSHVLPYVMNEDYNHGGNGMLLGKKPYDFYEQKIEQLVTSKNLQKQVFEAKKGDVFVWHANLLHGGEPHLNKKLSRKSMVFHYYADKAICFHEITQRPAFMKSLS